MRGKQSRCSPGQLLPEAALSPPGPDLRVPWPLTCPSGLELPGVGSQAHTLLGTQLGRQGWLRGGAVSAVRPCTSPRGAQGQEPRLWLAAASWPSLVLYEHLHLVDEVPGNPQDLLGIVMLSSFIEELDDVGEVHVVVTDNLTVSLHQGQGNE